MFRLFIVQWLIKFSHLGFLGSNLYLIEVAMK
jgi:hypothetical protein